MQAEKEELQTEKDGIFHTNEALKEQIGQIEAGKETLETEKRALLEEKAELKTECSKISDEVSGCV